jgi:hypothetical protein
MPDYLQEGSFPYMKRPYPKEIPFVDTVSFVRFCGGYREKWVRHRADHPGELDLAYIDDDGEPKYRWELVAERIDPYLEMGYSDIIISLDNVPYAMAAYESEGSYGQVAPPRDYKEWERFVEGLCRELVRLYGSEVPNSWAFRMGTENNSATRGSKHTFDGDHDQWIKWYDHSAAAVNRVLPDAKFGPGEFGGGIHPEEGPEPPKVNYVKLGEHCVTGTNTSTGETGAPLDFLANSSHAVPRWVDGKLYGMVNPQQRVDNNVTSYRRILKGRPEFANIPIYIFQSGFLISELFYEDRQIATNEPGGRGAAWTFHHVIGMKEAEPRMKGIWHWASGDALGFREGERKSYILDGRGWVFSILDHLRRGDAYVLATPPSEDETVYKSLFVKRDDSYYLVTSVFNADRSNTSTKKITTKIPAEHMQFESTLKVELVQLTEDNNVHRTIKNDLAREGFLEPEFVEHERLLASIIQMGGAAARDFVEKDIDKYEETVTDSLTLRAFDGSLEKKDGGYLVTFDAEPDCVTVVTFNHKPASPIQK